MIRSRKAVAAASTLVAALLVAALAGCTTSDPTSPDATAEADKSAVLDVAAAYEPITLNAVRSEGLNWRVIAPMYDRVVGVDENHQPDDSGIAQSWTRVDPLTWDFDIRQGVTFHDGSDLTAEDVAFTLLQGRDDPKSRMGVFLKSIATAEPVDDYTLRVTTVFPDNSLAAMLTRQRVIPSDYYQEVGGDGFALAPIGSGPFAFESSQSGQSLTLTRNDDYWAGAPQIAGIRFTWNPSASARAALVETGEADVTYDLPIQNVPAFESSADLQVASGLTGTSRFLAIRATDTPTDDPRLREAISLSIDRDLINESIFKDQGQKVSRFHTFSLPDVPEPTLDYDPERAREIVSSYDAAPQIVLTYSSGAWAQDKVLGEAVAGMLTDVGFDVTQDIKDNATIFEQAFGSTDGMNLWISEVDQAHPHPEAQVAFMEAGGVPGCVDAEQYAADSRAARAAEPAEEAAIYQAMEEKVLNQDFCYVPLSQLMATYGLSARVHGFEVPFTGAPDYTRVWIG